MHESVADRRVDARSAALTSWVRSAVRWLPLLLAVLLVWGLAFWIIAPRFQLTTPSFTDDWWAATQSPDQLGHVVRLGDPERVRYRPGWILWDYVQWHTFDAPRGLNGPNAWNVARLFVLVAGLSLLTAVALRPARNRRDALSLAALAALPALLVVTVPVFAVDLTRFGPQEPLLIGAMALGGALLLIAAQALLTESRHVQRLRTASVAAVGSGFWIIGVYQKEASIAVLPLLAAAVFVGRGRLAVWKRLARSRRVALLALGGIVLVPLAHVGVETALIARRGNVVYDTQVNGGRAALHGLWHLVGQMEAVLGVVATAVVVGAVVAVVVAFVITRKFPVLAVGAMCSGLLTLLLAGQAGVVVSRYYLPMFALFAVALSLSLARFRARALVLGIAVVATGFALASLSAARVQVDNWVAQEREWGEFLGQVTTAEASGCPVAAAGFEIEATQALPALVGLERRGPRGPCTEGGTYLVVGPDAPGAALLKACAPGASTTLRDWPSGSIYHCRRLSSEYVLDPEVGRVRPEKLISLRRLAET
jgi:hypothetical protein